MEDKERKEKHQLKSEGGIQCSSIMYHQTCIIDQSTVCVHTDCGKNQTPPCWCHCCADMQVPLQKMYVCLQHRELDTSCVGEHRLTNYTAVSWLNWMCRLCVHYHVCYSTFNAVAEKCEISLRFMVNQFSWKKLRHPQPALCGNICVTSDIWYGKKLKGEGDRVYCRAGQTPWVLVEAAKGCLCLHILHKRLQKCQPMRAWALKTDEA